MSPVRALLTAALLAGSLSGCSTPRLEALVQALETRGVQSCLWYEGHAGPYLSLRGVTMTGGATCDACRSLR